MANKKVGLDDYLVANGADAFRKLLDSATEAEKPKASRGRRVSQATELLRLVDESGCEFFHDARQKTYVKIQVNDHLETHSLRGQDFRDRLSRLYYRQTKRAIGSQALLDALNTLAGHALHEGPTEDVHVRVAKRRNRIWLDLGNSTRDAVAIGASGWKIVSSESPPVNFIRPKSTLQLPTPVSGGSVQELRDTINVKDEADFHLLVAWLLEALNPDGPHPILLLGGEQGSGKTTTARRCYRLIDPRETEDRSAPRNPHDLAIAASYCWILGLDNLSKISVWLSDCLCRLSTGSSFATRKYYTDSDEVSFQARRPVVINSIEDIATRGDLLDRAVVLTLPQIPDRMRQEERKLNQDFEEARPRILGALLDMVSCGLRELPNTELKQKPRMADFAEWVTKCERDGGADWSEPFIKVYRQNIGQANELALADSPLVGPLRTLAAELGPWTGTATDLLRELTARADERITASRDWPKGVATLGSRLRRLAPNLRKTDLDISSVHTGAERLITIQTIRQRKTPLVPLVPLEHRQNKDFSTNGSKQTAVKTNSSAVSPNSTSATAVSQKSRFFKEINSTNSANGKKRNRKQLRVESG